MTTLDENNITELAIFEANYTPTLNGLDCNVCGSALKDSYPGLKKIDPPNPTQTWVICDNCNFSGYRVDNT
jgi:hypothetical protein